MLIVKLVNQPIINVLNVMPTSVPFVTKTEMLHTVPVLPVSLKLTENVFIVLTIVPHVLVSNQIVSSVLKEESIHQHVPVHTDIMIQRTEIQNVKSVTINVLDVINMVVLFVMSTDIMNQNVHVSTV